MKLIFFFLLSSVLMLTACSSSNVDTNIQKQKYVAEKISPGTAIVVAEVKTINENSSSYNLDVQIKKVNGYGQSTKPIALNTLMKLDMRKDLITADMGKDFLKVGGEYELEISQPQKTINAESNSSWQINSIKK